MHNHINDNDYGKHWLHSDIDGNIIFRLPGATIVFVHEGITCIF